VDEALPKWATNPFDLVYKLRKVFETSAVTELLPAWIDIIWGVHHPKSLPHAQLFTVRHPHKNQVARIGRSIVSAPSEIVAKLTYSKYSKYEFVTCTVDGYVHFSQLNFLAGTVVHVSSVPSQPGTPLGLVRGRLFIYDSETSTMSSLGPAFECRRDTVYIQKVFVKVSTQGIVFLNRNDAICAIDFDGPDRHLCFVDTPVCCFEVSHEFQIVVFATIDFRVHIRALDDGRQIRVVSIGDELPVAILITKCWGFILVRTNTRIVVFNVNGLMIREFPIQEQVKLWTTFPSGDGFDYAVVHNAKDTLTVFEVMCPEQNVSIGTYRGLLSVDYDAEHEALVLVPAVGRVKIVPVQLPNKTQVQICDGALPADRH
jgi:hypothetical protein